MIQSEQPACQKCESALISRLFCFSCNALQPFPREIDFFEVLGFPVIFEMDVEALEERYQQLSLELHPDFYGSASEAEKRLSETASVILNTAYKTLREPTLRAGYLLYLLADKQKLDERILPDNFLQEIFFLQESLDKLLDSGDEAALSEMREDLRKRNAEIESQFTPLFRQLEARPGSPEILQKLQTRLNAERYLKRLLERIN